MSSVPHKKPRSKEEISHSLEKRANSRRYFKRLRLKQVISDEERFILQQAVRLDNGTMGEVVAVRKTNKGKQVYECHLCKCFAPDLTLDLFLNHFYGQKHANNLKKPFHYRKKFLLTYPNNKLKQNLDVGPLPLCQIQMRLDTCTKPLIGLEYLLEIDSNRFHCLLCNKLWNNEAALISHLTSKEHYLQYFNIFFQKVTNFLESDVKPSVSKNEYKKTIETVAKNIEQYFGRLKPRRVTINEAETSLLDILDAIDSGPHFWETPTQNFLDCIDINLIQGNELDYNEDCSNSNAVLEHNINLPSSSQQVGNRFNEDEKRFSGCTESDHESQQEYEEKVQEIKTVLLEEMVYYQKNPDKHPKYEMEYRKYYRERNEYLLRQGEDPKKYDIGCEFTTFWDMFLKEMYQNIFQKQKSDLQQKFEFNQSDLMGNTIKNTISRTKLNDGNSSTAIKRNYESPGGENDVWSSDSSNKRIKQPLNIQLILVLQHLLVLKHYLGSLGPKVDNLLSQALLEKTSSSSSILTENNCVMLETVKEKFLGCLQWGIFQQSDITNADTAIHNINNLLLSVHERKEQNHLDKIHSVSNEESYQRKIFYFGNQRSHNNENNT